MLEVVFLLVVALVWIIIATIQDLRTREIANWLNFSLVIFVMGFRFFYSFFSDKGFGFFYQGLIGLGIFFVLGNLLYYGKMFAGGDAKLMIALGAVLPFSEGFLINVKIFLYFFFIFLFVGAGYGIVYSGFLTLRNFKSFKKEFFKEWKENKKRIYFIMFFGLVLMALGFLEGLLFIFGVFIFVLPYLYVYAKAVDEACMIKKIKSSKLAEGDWLYKNLKVGRKVIKAGWGGLDKEDIKIIKKKYRVILIRQGIPFTPVFLISFIILVLIYFLNTKLWNAFW